MRRRCGQSGMSLMELLVALAIILILISSLIGVGSYVKTRASVDLTKGMLEVLSTSLEQYYADFNNFPFEAGSAYSKADLEIAANGLDGIVIPVTVSLLEKDGNNTDVSTASSAALFYFLDRNPDSRAVAEAVADSFITNKDDIGINIQITLNTVPPTIIDLPRYIDPWKMSIRYVYLPGTAFPVLTSAGPDKIFDTPDDITSK